jgi:hypothetical protein
MENLLVHAGFQVKSVADHADLEVSVNIEPASYTNVACWFLPQVEELFPFLGILPTK